MGIINILDPQMANLIAAGEVVERPASAIKELLENAIDAGADKITAEIKNGGVSLMRITDNGCGMGKEDALACIRRHATSKVRQASDLNGITTLGFRGEALAAICSVSKMRILTRQKGAPTGISVSCTAGNIESVEEAGCPEGTTVMAEELFYNVPARRKFLKRDASETAAVAAVVEKIALSRPDIGIRFITDGTQRFQTAGNGKLQDVIYAVLGREYARRLLPVEDMTGNITVSGFIGTPENCRGNRNCENFFVNGRFVKCLTAQAAVEQAFSSYIPAEKFPFCVLEICLHPALVDVNVHPQKTEVRFTDDKSVFNAVYCAVRNTIMNHTSRPDIQELPGASVRYTSDSYRLYSDIMNMKTNTEEEARRLADERDALNIRYEQIKADSALRDAPPLYEPPKGYEEKPLPEGKTPSAAEKPSDIPGREAAVPPAGTPLSSDTLVPPRTSPADTKTQDVRTEPSPAGETPAGASDGEEPFFPPFGFGKPIGPTEEEKQKTDASGLLPLPWYRVIGVVFNCYVFVELEDKMLVVDKHAAHERILFEKMRENMRIGDPASQILLFPIELSLTHEELAAAGEYREELRKVGYDFDIDKIMGRVSISMHPSALNNGQASDMFTEICGQLAAGTGDTFTTRDRIYEKALYQASCKAAVKGGREDLPENIRWIVEQVLTDPRIRYCPHGRPVAFELTKAQFEKRFERT